MEYLEGALRTYPWGSRTLLASLRGTPAPAPTPEAELWFGAHPAAPSRVDGALLDAVISNDPEAALGARVAADFDGQLPFLVKLLAAGEPLSIQAHPSAAQAREGFERENALGIALNDSRRNYKDPNPKPELIVALTKFHALAGFRPVAQTQQLFAVLGGLGRYAGVLDPAQPSESLRTIFTTLISLPSALRLALLEDVATAAAELAETAPEPWMAEVARTFLRLADRYPGDVGALAALLLNHVTLQPGDALYLAAGQLHAYLSGLGVEVMANSDNVLRGGLTSKHVDVPELVRVLDFSELSDPHAPAEVADGTTLFNLPIDAFTVSRHRLGAGSELRADTDGPAVVLCTAGRAQTGGSGGSSGSGEFALTPGQAAWIPASDPAVTFTAADGEGAEQFAELFYVRA
ncbi:mannose-6-phosphate isomerase, class I [Corynebacterium aquatimens]|uniref:mannose-6-phosphate isomerase, class I n=1 Tax=Corynebacterium TaxID=1716 RepID=UPI001F3D016E|nr:MULTISPECIES: mannose-6-phosphate isomerase, class I [Corynebacterium]QYH20151.1 mannose-6-phosphate isomerase, class I [Corynebacterium aquatimens]UIZ92616.1 mannose-6-phosphate isomerase, class I [Corynebacterium sp. CNCTC7651]